MNQVKTCPARCASKTRILIVDDHPIVCEGLAQLIHQQQDLEVCAATGNGKHALEVIEKEAMDLAIIDIMLGDMDGLALTAGIRYNHPNLPVLILSMHDDLFYVKNALAAGANGYITKDEAAEEIITAIHHVLKGKIYIGRKLAKKFSRGELGDLLKNNFKKSLA